MKRLLSMIMRSHAAFGVGRVEPPGPAFGRPDDKLRETHPRSSCSVQLMMGFARAQPILHRRAKQMLDLDAEAGVEFVGQPLPVAMGGVALIAEQAQRAA